MQQSGREFETAPYQEQAQQEQLAELHLQLESEQQKSEEYLDLLRRTQADFINYKRRMGQEQQEGRIAGQVAVLEQVLPVLDDLGRALSSAPPELANSPWVQGVLLVARRLMSTLEQMGVRQIGRPGEPFDPRLHEAVSIQANTGAADGTIAQVTRPGYALGERIIRPAQVIVAGHS